MSAPKYLTAAEVAERLRKKPMTIVRLCREGKLPATNPTGRWLIREDHLEEYLAKKSNQAGRVA